MRLSLTSSIAKAKARMQPAARWAASNGSEIRRKVDHALAPSDLAACSSTGSLCWRPATEERIT